MGNDEVSELIHLYVDGAFNRRELVKRLTRYTGTVAAAMAAIETAGLAQTTPGVCPAGVQVAETDPALISQNLKIYGEAGPLFVYQSVPKDSTAARRPAVLVIHENRGLNDHIKDVTRRIAKAGYVGIAVDLLSRQGGTDQFTDPARATEAYNRTTVEGRRQDMLSTLYTIRDQPYVRNDRLGAIGFCAGGTNVLDLVTVADQLSGAAAFYGTPPTPIDQMARVTAPLLLMYGELDRNTTGRAAGLLTTLNDARKSYEMHVYPNANHAFYNDTGAAYNPAAACDAWAKTMAFFDRTLNRS